MTAQDLIAAGFKAYDPHAPFHWDKLYQLKVTDEYGTRYFIDVMFWQHSKHAATATDSWEMEISYGDGCAATGSEATRIKVWPLTDWTVDRVLKCAAGFWDRLAPNYYERER